LLPVLDRPSVSKRCADEPAKASTSRREATGPSATSSSAPGARRAATPAGGRRASRKFSLVPSSALLGVVALIVAGAGAVAVSSGTPGAPQPPGYTPLSSNLTVSLDPRSDRLQQVQVSRSIEVDRETLNAQAQIQAEQRTEALAELVAEANATADELRAAEKAAEEAAEEAQANQWVLPVAGYVLSATYGEVSSYWSTYHTGLDFAAASGTPLVSVAQGTVTYVGYDGAYGNKTEITLTDGTVIWYAHQTSQVVSTGDVVQPGELIGYVGATGNVTGPHLHLEVRMPTVDGIDGQDVDPYQALADHGVTP
jgi:murein DD-endopeptidase MepM/ murein hydrolase activator NlpD